MLRTIGGILVVLLYLAPAPAGGVGLHQPASTNEQYQALVKEFNIAARGLWTATTDEDRAKAAARGVEVTPRLLDLIEKNPNEPFVLDALAQVVVQVNWVENNTTHPGFGKESPTAKAVAILMRDHIRSEKLGQACWRTSQGFGRECETFLRTVQEKSPHREVRGLASFRLAQFLNSRSRRLDLLQERPEMIERFEGLFGKDYVQALRRRDRDETMKEVEAAFESAGEKYGDLKLPFGGTVGESAASELHEIRHLSVGKTPPDIEGEDQDGKRFKLSDYRGKVVLLDFWSFV
jgi:hypothetical protein